MIRKDARAAALDQDELTGCLQRTLAALADIEFEFQLEYERLEAWPGPATEKERLLSQLESKRQHRREPLNQLLAELQDRVRWLTVYRHRSGPGWEADAGISATVAGPRHSSVN